MSHVMCHMSLFFFGQSGEAKRGRVCYQWGLPRLVFIVSALEGLLSTGPTFLVYIPGEN